MSNYNYQTQISPDSHISDPVYANYYGPSTQNINNWNYGQPVPTRPQATVNLNSGFINPSNPGFVNPDFQATGYRTYYTAGGQVNPGPALANPAPNPNQSSTGGQVNPEPALPNQISSSAPAVSQASKTSHRKRKDQNKQSKKNKKNKNNTQTETTQADEADEVPVFDASNTQNKTAVGLRCLAKLHATSNTDSKLVNAILQLHKEIETLKAIKALELGTTVAYIDQVFGKYIAVRRPSGWNYFLRSDVAKAIFKAASGISNGTAMKILSQEWGKMDKKEKQVYKDLAKAGGSLRSDVEVEATETDLATLEEDLESINVGSQSRSNILQSRTNILVNPRCLKQYKTKAEQLLEETLNHCMPIAKANHFEVVMVAVSNHIGKHNFQITNFTAGANKAVSMIYGVDGVNNFPARLQALMLGKTPGELASAVADSSKRFQSRVVGALSSFLHEITGLKNWPWSRCDKVLSEAGYEVKLLPGARSQLQTLKTPSAELNQPKLLALDSDLKENLIQLVRKVPQDNEPGQTAHHNQVDNPNTSTLRMRNPSGPGMNHPQTPNSNFDPSLM